MQEVPKARSFLPGKGALLRVMRQSGSHVFGVPTRLHAQIAVECTTGENEMSMRLSSGGIPFFIR